MSIARRFVLTCSGVAALAVVAFAQSAREPGLLFHLSGERGLTADFSAGGTPEPNFAGDVKVVPDGAKGAGIQCAHTQVLSYWAPGNVSAERGTLSLFWRAPRAGRTDAVSDLSCRLRRPLELGHGVAEDRLQREAWLRRVRHRRQPGPHARVLRAAHLPGCRPVGPPRPGVGRDAGHPLLRGRNAGGEAGHHRGLLRRVGPVRSPLARHQPIPGAERLQLRARRRYRRTAHLRPHAVRREHRGAEPQRDAGWNPRPRPRRPFAGVARRVVAPLRMGSSGGRPPGTRPGCHDDSKGRDPRRLRPQTVVVEGDRRHPRDDLAGRLQQVAPARQERLLPASRLGLLLVVREDGDVHAAGRALEPGRGLGLCLRHLRACRRRFR